MDTDKQRQEISLIGRILSTEGLIFLMGCVSLVYGLVKGVMTSVFWGLLILCGFFVLLKVRKRDWKKHWEEMEAEQKARNDRSNQKPPSDSDTSGKN